MTKDIVEPPFAYLGGKKSALKLIRKTLPSNWKPESSTFVEPFMGSGVVFLNLPIRRAIISDIEFPMICLYDYLKKHKNLSSLLRSCKGHFESDSRQHFEVTRKALTKYDNLLEFLGAYIYVRRRTTMGRCYYNPNKEEFITRYRTDCGPVRLDAVWNKINKIADKVRTMSLTFNVCDFAETIQKAKSRDFLFLDPPYFDLQTPTKYYSSVFTLEDQERLVHCILKAHKKGCYIMLFNLYSPALRKALPVDFKFQTTKEQDRKRTRFANYSEIMVTNY